MFNIILITVYMLCYVGKINTLLFFFKYIFGRNVHFFLAETSIFFGRIVHAFGRNVHVFSGRNGSWTKRPVTATRQRHFFRVNVGRNLWICDIHGSRCAIYGSIRCAEIHGLRRNLWIAQGSIYRSTGSLSRPSHHLLRTIIVI